MHALTGFLTNCINMRFNVDIHDVKILINFYKLDCLVMMTRDKNVGVYVRSIIISFVLATLIVRKDDFHHLVK